MSFHVPEGARNLTHPLLGTTCEDGNNGAFYLASCEPGWMLWLIASDGLGWEHVSVRATNEKRDRVPTWREMAFIKDLCWDGEDVVVQFHPRKSEYVNCHTCALHLWRPTSQTIPTPVPLLVGPRQAVTA